MGAAESPDRKRRRHDSKERHRQDSRDRLDRGRGDRRDHSRERGSHRGREAEGSTRHKQGDYDPSDRRDRPGTTCGRGREQEHVNGRSGGSRQASPDRPRNTHDRDRQQDRRTDGSRDRSRERQHDRDKERDRERQRGPDRDREGQHETHRRGDRGREKEWDRDRDRGGTDKGGRAAAPHRDDRPTSRSDREGREMDRSRGPRPEQQQDRFAEPPRREREHSHRDTGGAAGSSRQQQQQRRDQPPEGKPKWGKPEEWAADEAPPPSAPKEAPNMGLSGKLAAETNKTADGTAELKFQAPAEARVCKKPVWKLFVYKGQDAVGEPIPLTQLPFYMFGKDRKVADIPTDHPSCSRQHAVLVFREVEADAPDGIGYVRTIKPYLLDLETTNGTTINKEKLEPARYYELLSADVIRFGFSSRDYVIMNEAVVQ